MRTFWTSNQYSLFRFFFGCYLITHFGYLLPWAAEIFSNQGMISNSMASPIFGVIPNLLQLNDSPIFVNLMITSALFSAVLFTIGVKDKLAAIWMLYVLICLFARNPLIANPALPYVGWMLLAHLFIPSKPHADWSMGKDKEIPQQWHMPQCVYYAAVVILALSYSYSGYTKLLSPSWVSGEAISYVLENLLARHYWLPDFLMWLPPLFLKLLTWFILYVELLYAPLALIRGTHKWLWLSMLVVQFGFLFLLSFPDLTFAMILFHLFTFNPNWLKPKPAIEPETVYYDGECGICHGYIKLLLAEDKQNHFYFAPLQGQSFINNISSTEREGLPISMLVRTDCNQLLTKSDAVIHCLIRLGGLWRVIGMVLSLFPRFLRNYLYDCFARIRQFILPKPEGICPILSPELAKRFLG